MDTINNDTDISELIKMYAEKKNISEPAAYLALKRKWVPRSQVFDLVDQNTQETAPTMTSDLLIEKTRAATEKARLEYEQKRLELLDKSELREQRRLEMQEAKIQSDERIAMQRLEFDRNIAAQRADAENRRLAMKEEFDQKLLLIQTNKTGSGDMFEQINQVNKLEQTFSDRMIARAEALGVDAATLKKLTGSSKSEGFNFNKLLDLAAPFVEKAHRQQEEIKNTPSGLEKQAPAPSTVTNEIEDRIRSEVAAKSKELQYEKMMLQQELEDEKKKVKAIEHERKALESRASELGIEYTETTTNNEIFYAIEMAEAQNELNMEQAAREKVESAKESAEREKLINRALDLGLPFDSDISNFHLNELIEKWEKDLDHINSPAEQPAANIIKKPRRKEKVAKKALKDLKNFEIQDMDGSLIQEIEGKSYRSAALLIAKQLKGTLENPVRIRIKRPGEEEGITFDTWLMEREGKNGQVFSPRIKEIKEAVQPEKKDVQEE